MVLQHQSSVITVTTKGSHGLNVGTPIRIKGVTNVGETDAYNVSTKVINVDTRQ